MMKATGVTSPGGARLDSNDATSPAALVRRLAETASTPCPCGEAFRIITGADNDIASFHVVEIRGEATKHYHKRQTEFYYCLEGKGVIELGDARYPFEPGTAIMIPPGTPHAARGHFTIVNVVVPPFDPNDEYPVE
jgi:mannose-6-phosphate isomerase-like protein (cupin superfamily)